MRVSQDPISWRDSLAAAGITYTVRDVGGKQGVFFSYSGTYEEGDRIVASPDCPAMVLRVEPRDREPTLLFCKAV